MKVIVGSVADGSSVAALLRGSPTIKKRGIRAALRFAAEAVSGFAQLTTLERLVPVILLEPR